MTCREKFDKDNHDVGVCMTDHCPSDFGYMDDPPSCMDIGCRNCWDREIPEKPKVVDIGNGVLRSGPHKEPWTPKKKEENKLIYKHVGEPIAKVTDVKISDGGCEVIMEPIIKDSGERTVFSTGSVRDMHEGKGDMASVPWEAILRLSVHYENGAKKYERWNFRKGIPVSSFIDSACRHLAKYQCGCDDEDHLAAAAFNVLGAMLMENTKPEMVDLPLRQGKNTFEYFKEE